MKNSDRQKYYAEMIALVSDPWQAPKECQEKADAFVDCHYDHKPENQLIVSTATNEWYRIAARAFLEIGIEWGKKQAESAKDPESPEDPEDRLAKLRKPIHPQILWLPTTVPEGVMGVWPELTTVTYSKAGDEVWVNTPGGEQRVSLSFNQTVEAIQKARAVNESLKK